MGARYGHGPLKIQGPGYDWARVGVNVDRPVIVLGVVMVFMQEFGAG